MTCSSLSCSLICYHASFRNIIFQLPSMSPGDAPTPNVTAVKASIGVEIQPALDSSTDDTTTTGAPVEKVCICLFYPLAGNRVSRWSSVGQPLRSRSNTAVRGDAESRTTTRIRDILRARRRLEFRRFHRAVAVFLGHRSNACAWCDACEPIALGVFCLLICFFV